MTFPSRSRFQRTWTEDELAVDALRRLRELTAVPVAADGAAAARQTNPDLQDAVNIALNAGASWQNIGDALGIRRGSAYQRYRRRTSP